MCKMDGYVSMIWELTVVFLNSTWTKLHYILRKDRLTFFNFTKICSNVFFLCCPLNCIIELILKVSLWINRWIVANFAKTFTSLWYSYKMIVTLTTSDSLKFKLNSETHAPLPIYLGILIPVNIFSLQILLWIKPDNFIGWAKFLWVKPLYGNQNKKYPLHEKYV